MSRTESVSYSGRFVLAIVVASVVFTTFILWLLSPNSLFQRGSAPLSRYAGVTTGSAATHGLLGRHVQIIETRTQGRIVACQLVSFDVTISLLYVWVETESGKVERFEVSQLRFI